MISTISPVAGGVITMTSFIVDTLKRHGLEPVIAYYEPYSQSQHLSVPSFKLFQRLPGKTIGRAYGDCEAHGIGAWLPELEFTNYFATKPWRSIIDQCAAHIMISGSILAATPFLQSKRSFLAWVATDWDGDRADRIKHFPLPRKLLDRYLNAPVIRALEKKLLQSGETLALSSHTANALSKISPNNRSFDTLSMPVDTKLFDIKNGATIQGRIGFTGRFDDPRKNITLLLEAIALIKKNGGKASAHLIGAHPTSYIMKLVNEFNLSSEIEFLPQLNRIDLVRHLQTFDVFVLPSHQEGLCISALEAMACGVPVISTRCGGPEEYVIENSTGALISSSPMELANAIIEITSDREKRDRLARGARQLIENKYSITRSESIFMNAFTKTFPNLRV